MGVDVEELLARIDRARGSQKVYPWGAANGLGRGTIGRLLKGSLPDAELLIPMVRREGLSLSWLLTGQGTPYVFHSPASDAQGADLVRALFDEMSMPRVLILRNRDSLEGQARVAVVLSETVHKHQAGSEPYTYEHAEVIGGAECGPLTASVALGTRSAQCKRIILNDPEWRRLVSGYMALPELWELVEICPTDTRPDYVTVASKSEPSASDRWNTLSDLEQRVVTSLRRLDGGMRETTASMVEAAARVSRTPPEPD